MTDDPFDLGGGAAYERLAQLARRADDLPDEAQDLVNEILEAFSVSVEELRVAAEELHQQNEELLAAREEVEAGRRRYRDLFEFAPDGYLVTDPAGIIYDANQAAVDLLGVPKVELLSKPLAVYVAPGERGRFHRLLDRLVEGGGLEGRPPEWEMRLQPRRGASFPAALTVGPVRDVQGALTGLRWLLRDVSASKRAQERERLLQDVQQLAVDLERERQLQQTIMEHTTAHLAYLDPEFNFLRVNATYAHSAGYRREELIGRNAFELFPNPENQAVFERVRETGEPVTIHAQPFEFPARSGRGTTYWDWTLVPVKDKDGAVQRLVLSSMDVTAQVEARAERERLLTILEATPDAVVMSTVAGEVLYLNQAAREMAGLAEDADLSELRVPFSHPEWASRLLQEEAIPTALREGVWRGRTAVTSGDGREIPVSQVLLAHEGPEGEVETLSSIARDVSERERILARLQEERTRFEAIFEGAPQAILVADNEGRILLANLAAHELYRRPVPFDQPFDAADSVQVRHPDGRPFARDEYPILRSALEGERIPPVEMEVIWEDGHRRDLLVSAAPLQDVDGGLLGAVSLVQDVSEQKEAQRALRLYADRLHTLHLADRVILTAGSVDEIVETVLPLVRELVDCRRASVLAFDQEAGEAVLLGVHTHGETRLDKGWRMSLDERWPLEDLAGGEMRLLEDVSTLTVSDSMVEDLVGQGVHAFVSVPLVVQEELLGALNLGLEDPESLTADHREILRQMADQLAIGLRQAELHRQVQHHTERLEERVARRTAALRASEARFRAVFESAGLGIALLDRKGRISASNPALQSILDYSGDALRGRALSEFSHPDDDTSVEDALHRALMAGEREVYQIEKRYVCHEDRMVWANLIVSLVRGGDGAPRFAVAMVEEITEQKRAQEALVRSEKLMMAGRLAASLAHEINNPLQSVIGCLGLAQETLPQGEENLYLRIAREELHRTREIVDHLRDLARPSEPLEKEPADLNELLERVLVLAERQYQDRKIETTWQGAKDLPPVPMAVDQIQQVLLNLVLNAFDAMPEGGRLALDVKVTSDPAGVSVWVRDTGSGIAPDLLPHIFDPFYSTKTEGLGLGLFISQNIVSEHGGWIDVESQVGEGSTFTVWLPLGR